MPATFVTDPNARRRLAAVTAFVRQQADAGQAVLIVGTTRAAADEIAARIAVELGSLVNVRRASLAETAVKLALPALTTQALLPTAALGDEALAARAVFESRAARELAYFTPVAEMPGFPRALGRTLAELRMAEVDAAALTGDPALDDLRRLLARSTAERRRAGAVDYATLLAAAADAAGDPSSSLRETTLVLLDVPAPSAAEVRFVRALIAHASDSLVTVAGGDARTIQALNVASTGSGTNTADEADGGGDRALDRLQRFLFADQLPPPGSMDDSVVVFSAPGEGREAVEIARRVLDEAARGVPFDEMAVLVRAPQSYLSLLEHALDRAGVPAWYFRGTRRPDPSGRALLALLMCADEGLSARRFAEYVSLGQVPDVVGAFETPGGTVRPSPEPAVGGPTLPWEPPIDEAAEAVVPERDRPEDVQPEEERQAQAARGATDRAVAGTLRAPWRWEDLIVEAAVIGGIDRWERRLAGLARDYQARLREMESEDPNSSRTRAIRRDVEQLEALRAFALPVLAEMARWPPDQSWGDWLRALSALAPIVLARPARVLRVLQDLSPLAAIGPVGLREVCDVLAPRLSTLTHDPPKRRFGRIFVGTPHAARGRSFRVVFVPGLAERMFPQRVREDALLLDERRATVGDHLSRQASRAADERLQLTLAAGAARERLYVSYPRLELSESRPRVPSFYVLDIVRAVEGAIPSAARVADRAYAAGRSRLAWPAPERAADAIDAFEHDLSTLGRLLAVEDPATARGRARYLYELSPDLRRSLTSRWMRWHRRQWEPADGLVRSVPETTAPALARQRLSARPYSLTALQHFSSCPYRFLLSAIYRLAPLEEPAPLQRLDPLTRGSLFHDIQAHVLRRLQAEGLLPLSPDHLARAQKLLEWSVTKIGNDAYDKLAPAIERVWRDEIETITRDLKIWLEHLVDEGAEWTPERFEWSFGLDDRSDRDPASTTEPAHVDGRFLLRGSIDMIERHRQTSLLRVTDHKTGKNRTEAGRTIVAGGRVLQPVLYGLALEALSPGTQVAAGRLSFCTSAGDFSVHEIPLFDAARRAALEVLDIVDRDIEQGLLAARPDRDACRFCDFLPVCGPNEERRTKKKEPTRFADLDALRALP